MTTDSERLDKSTNVDWTSKYEINATDAGFLYENSIFAMQIGVAVSVSCLVILIATVTCCVYKPKRGTYTFPISKSEENVVMAIEGPPQPTRSTDVLAEKYSDPIDKASMSNETAGPRFCATKSCQNAISQKAEHGCEYQHLDFTLRFKTSPHSGDNSEYDHTRANMVSVFNQPWDTASSKVSKLCSQISKSVVQKGQNVRKSLIKRRASRSGSPKSKCRVSNNCDAWETQFNHQQFVFDSDVDNQINKSTDVTDSIVDVSNDEPEFIHAASSFAVLPFSERINVKSTHIYDEPDDRRLSLRDRLLHMLPIRSDKMPFGIQLDLRGSRRESKIYSLATPIDEIDESVA
ncbi:uncharacterized protein LOC127708908 isoform X2 [Mytilus californianus]|uniref:uncharacterized protein LOC127708908 isoform X2 n=1 Tax=Mytilus californianus TaxID=6549 RepID=UPI0022468753|nr:uncharacterized protein LOC127708908 isoform X2 [Mytilus californianus]